MRRWRALFGLTLVFLISATAVFFLSVHLIQKSHPRTTGTLKLPGLRNVVKITRDNYGVPHITANNDDDVFFALGYVTAQDRLWQMDIFRRTAQGTLSEIFGEKTIASDRLFRVLGLNRIAILLGANMSEDSRRMLQNYVNGINTYILGNLKNLPIEYALTNNVPTVWTIDDCLTIQRLYAWFVSVQHNYDLLSSAIIERVEPSKRQVLLRSSIPRTTPCVPSATALALQDAILPNFIPENMWPIGGSAWAVSGTQTTTGHPLLAFDLRGPYNVPSLYYEIHLSAPFLDAYGWIIPGFPGMLAGKNKNVVWATIPSQIDDMDFFVEQLRKDESHEYNFQGTWKNLDQIIDIIPVKGQIPDTLTIRMTNHGPIISDILRSNHIHTPPIALQWTGASASDEALGFFRLLKSQTINEAGAALRKLAVPSMKFLCVDDAGNIQSGLVGTIPKRKSDTGLAPRAGWLPAEDWDEFIPMSQIEKLNPEQITNIICTDHPPVLPDLNTQIVGDWTPDFRMERIAHLLAGTELFDTEYMQRIQMDTYSMQAERLMPKVVDLLKDIKSVDNDLQRYFLDAIQVWNHRIERDDIAPAIFEIFTIKLMTNVFHDELGNSLFQQMMRRPELGYHYLNTVLEQLLSPWFDRIDTPSKETRENVVLTSLNETFAELQTRHGELIDDWRWGKMHTFMLQHPLADTSTQQYPLNRGPFQASGDNFTLLLNGFIPAETTIAQFGSVVRAIIDSGNMDSTFAIMSTGQSGQPMSAHYTDQTQLWLNGKYRQTTMNTQSLVDAGCDVLTLKPETKAGL
ncbi:penicillin acylase family protein [candidate division KSB1 bacterium]|nr:penicillin acylase family protein [candidate division KSB1 bacterium]